MKCTHPLCNKEFKTRKALNAHIRQAHPSWYKLGGKREDKRKGKKSMFKL